MSTTGINPTRTATIAALRKGTVPVSSYRVCACSSQHALAQIIYRLRKQGWVIQCVNPHFSHGPAYYQLIKEGKA
jgi:hypothetical protein